MKVTFDSTILGGMPVEVTATICGAEPDVGISQDWAEIDSIRFPSRFRKRDRKTIMGTEIPQKLLDRITKDEMENLALEALGA